MTIRERGDIVALLKAVERVFVVALILLNEEIFNVAILSDLENSGEVDITLTYGSHALFLVNDSEVL